MTDLLKKTTLSRLCPAIPGASPHLFRHRIGTVSEGGRNEGLLVTGSCQDGAFAVLKIGRTAAARERARLYRACARKLDPHLFNEAYLMHSSTSPQYAIIASCDVSAAMMEAPGGRALVEESIAESLDFRRAMRKVDAEYGKDWWFKVWGPEKLAPAGIGHSADWMLKANAKWHGFGNLAEGFNLLDPIKCTIITPGLDVSGRFAKTGIPAAIVTKFLVEHGIVVEKTGLYSFFIMFTIGITKGRWNTLVTALQQFKDDFDRNAPLWKIMPEFCASNPRYERIDRKST